MFVVDNKYEALFGALPSVCRYFYPSKSISFVSADRPDPTGRYLYFLYGFQGILALTNLTDLFISGVRLTEYGAYYAVAGRASGFFP